MATAPLSFFSSPPYAYPSAAAYPYPHPASAYNPAPAFGSFPSTAIFSPPPSGFGAPAPNFFPAPSPSPPDFHCAATYHETRELLWPPPPPNWPIWPPPPPAPSPTPSTAPSAFPNTASPFPYAASYPYPPPASSPFPYAASDSPFQHPTNPNRTPGSSLTADLSSPTPESTLPTADLVDSVRLSPPPLAGRPTTALSTSTQIDPHQAPPSSTIAARDDATRAGSSSSPLSELPKADSSILTEREPVLTAPTTTQQWVASAPTPNRELHPPQSRTSSKTYTRRPPVTSPPSPRRGTSSLLELPDLAPPLELHDPDGTSSSPGDRESRAPGAPLPATSDLPAPAATRDTTDALARPPLDCLLDDVCDPTSEVTSSAPTIIPGSTTTSTNPPRFSSGPSMSISTDAPANSLSSPFGASLAVYTPTSHSTVPAAPYVACQVLDEILQCYGLHSLDLCSLFRADGTEHSYFALPADYPLPQATPPMSPTAVENVGVTVPSSVAAHEPCLVPALCSKTNNTAGPESLIVPNLQLPMNVRVVPHVFKEEPAYAIYEEEDSVCLNITSDVQEFTLELQQPDDEMAYNCSDPNASDSVVTGSSQLSIEHSMRELRLLWDPASHASSNQVSIGHSMRALRTLWDPGATKFLVQIMIATGVTELHTCLHPRFSNNCEIHKLLHSLVTLKKMIHWPYWKLPFSTALKLFLQALCANTAVRVTKQRHHPGVPVIPQSYTATPPIVTHPGAFTHLMQPIFASAIMCYLAFNWRWPEVNAAARLVLVFLGSKGKPVAANSILLSTSDTSMKNNYFPKLLIQLLCAATTIQLTEQSHLVEFSLLAEMLLNASELDGQLAYMPQHTSITSSEQWDPGIDQLEMSKLSGKLEFIHQQSINENLKTKCLLLSSKEYLQIWDIGTFFTTFLPP